MARHSFQPRKSIFPRFVLYFPILRALLQEISPFIIATLLFSHSVNAFSFRASLSSSSTPPSYFLSISFPPLIHPPPSPSSPTFFLIPPHFSIFLPNNTRTRALRAYAYTRTHIHFRRFSFIAFTSSPILRNPLGTNTLGVKENEKRPSQNAQQPHNQNINTKHPISSAVNFI